MRAQFAGVAAFVALVALVVVAGLAAPPRTAPIATDRLGPESGTRIADYLAQAQDSLAGPDEPRYALISLRAEITAQQAYDLAAGSRIAELVFRVPLPRVQTPVVAVGVGEGRDSVLGSVAVAADRLRTAAARSGGNERQHRIATVSAQRIGDGCACVVALTIRATPTVLRAVAGQPQVRAVEALPADAVAGSYALVPLLPENTDIVEPLPDDGDVPAE